MEKVEQLQVENVEEEEVVEVTEDCKDPQPPAVELLWVFGCELTRRLSVTTMAWNKKNPVTLIRSSKTSSNAVCPSPSLCFLNSTHTFTEPAK